MSEQYPGGLITKTPVTPSGSYETSTASGVWTLSQQSYWSKLGLWPTAGNSPPVVSDPYFEYVTTLLHGDGTNGAQNNTFVDSSTNAYSITRSGSFTGQGSFSPFGTLWSNYFDGTAQLSFPSNSGYAFGTGDFTVECWYYATSNPGYRSLIESRATNGTNNGWALAADSGGTMYVYANGFILTGISVVLNTWNHVAFTRSGSTQYLFLNGALVSTSTTARTYSDTTLGVGGVAYSTGEYWTGYLSNVRLIKGTCLYTTTFTPSTTPLTAVSGTTLLTCQSNRFVDNSTTAATITPGTAMSAQRFSPFNPTSAYSTATIGGTGYFSQSSYLYSASTSGYDWGTGNGTMECWFYAATQSTNYPGLISSSNYGSTGACALRWDNIYYKGEAWLYINGGGDPILTSGQLARNAWHHVAIVRNGSTVTMYVDGVSKSTATWSGAMLWSNGEFRIGRGFDVDGSNAYYTGYISNVRNVKGTAVYTGSTYTIPTAPLSAISGTQFLCNTSNAGVVDNAMMTAYNTVGSAQISTATFQYGTGSLYFPGSSYIIDSNPTLGQLGTGDFTVEYWDRHGTQSSSNYSCQVGTLSTGSATGTWRFGTFTNNVGVYFAYNAGSGYVDLQFGSTAYNDNTWRHFAVTRSGTTLRAFVNGVQVGTNQTVSANFNSANNLILGAEFVNPTYFVGYIDDLRITKGYARYTANFTPPTTAFPNQ
jgi:hypothetical protein